MHVNKDDPVPKLIPYNCTHGTCADCGVNIKYSLLNHPLLLHTTDKVKVFEWKDMRRQGDSCRGGTNQQRELTEDSKPIPEIINSFKKALDICRPHYQEIMWIRIIQDIDIQTLPNDTLLIFTDFAATMVLRAFQAKNSSVDAYAILDNFVCLYNRWNVQVEQENIKLWTVDVHHYLAETLTKGKKSDHAMHNQCLDHLIPFYKKKFASLGRQLKIVKVWSDNAPTQYRCRQNFVQVATVQDRHPDISLIHRLAVVDNFKGAHDAYGKVPKRHVAEQELNGNRSPNGEGVFRTCFRNLTVTETTGTRNNWSEFERNKDRRLKGKGTYGMDARYFYFVVETKEEKEALICEFPDNIIHCDRTNILDTKGGKAIKGTTKLHEVRSMTYDKTTPHQNTVPLVISDLPCECLICNKSLQPSQQQSTTPCTYKRRRKQQKRMVTLASTEGAGTVVPHGDHVNVEQSLMWRDICSLVELA